MVPGSAYWPGLLALPKAADAHPNDVRILAPKV